MDKLTNKSIQRKCIWTTSFNKQTDKEFIGKCGLLTQEVDGIKEIEVGYHIMKKYRRQGYAPEAAKLFFDYALRNYLTISMISIIDIRNIKSQRVAEKNGLRKKNKPVGKILRFI
ncbi:hypothetical protein BH23BAC1_BH23BAC1_35930 [soil metagenome]